ncbi:amino acid ABC transporter permease [Phaeovulum sp.]|uniref:amino acid ABC transporter permease n=1 Tax=Phaeovulum sp. TaxID=2934796 RepID=UPI0039E4C179
MTYANFLQILLGLPITIALTGVAFLVGAILGFPLMLARQSKIRVVRILTLALITLIRAIPPIVWLFIVFFGVGVAAVQMSPFVSAAIVFGIIATVNMAEIYRGGMISIHEGQWEAARALNLGHRHTFTDIIIPQMFRVSLPSAATYAIGLLKDSSIASTIGVIDLAYRGSMVSQMTFKGLEVFAVVGVLYILISLPIAWLSRMADYRLQTRVAR